jgi:hypothetical protein
LPPQPTRPDGSPSARQPLSCSCSGGPSGPCFAHTYLCRCSFSTIPFRIRTSEKHARKPCRIRTSKTQDLKSFRIRTYKKTGGEGPLPAVTSSTSRPYSLARGAASHSAKLSRRGGHNGPGAKSLVHCLSHGGSLLEQIRLPSRPGGLTLRSHTFSVSLTNHKTKASQPCLRDS